MKTLNFLLFSLSIIIFSPVSSQNFAPPDATWHYEIRYAFEGKVDFIKYNVAGDTVINGKSCTKIIKSGAVFCYNEGRVEFVYSNNDSVYYYNEAYNDFYLLYVLSANKGESWTVYRSNLTATMDTVIVDVLMASTTLINGQQLRTLDVTYTDWSGVRNSTIIERFGDLTYMFPWFPSLGGICDMDYAAGLRCYEDPSLGFHSLGIADSCEARYIEIGITEFTDEMDIEVYPNPVSDELVVKQEMVDNGKIEIYNSLNQKVYESGFQKEVVVNTQAFATGMYNIYLRENQEVYFQRFIKE